MLRIARLLTAAVMIAAGLYLAIFGNAWAPIMFELTSGSEIGAWLELLVPFLPMVFIALGAALFVLDRR